MSWKDDYIAKYGQEAYDCHLARNRVRNNKNQNKVRENTKAWAEKNPEKVIAKGRQWHRNGGKFYEKTLVYEQTGLRGERNRIRRKHRSMWGNFKHIIAVDSQIHHQWCPNSAEYDGMAIVERDQHQQGIIDVIQILEGEITLLSEDEIRRWNINE